MLKIRLRRMGSRHRPFYRVVVSDSRRTPTASALEEVGYYDPRKKPAALSLDLDRVDEAVGKGRRGANENDGSSRNSLASRRYIGAKIVSDRNGDFLDVEILRGFVERRVGR